MPDLLFDVAGSFFVETNFYFHWFIVNDLEGALHVSLEVEVARDLEGFVGYIHHFDAVQDEHADFVSQVAFTDEVKGGVEEHDLVGVNLAAVFFSATTHCLIDHVYGFVPDCSVVNLLNNLFEPFEVLVGLETDVEGLLYTILVRQGFRGESGFDFLKEGLQ